MPDEVVFIIDKNGDIHGLYTETIDFDLVGQVSIHRASSVEFNNDTKQWDVHLENGTYICSRRTRSEAIEAEVEYLHSQLR